MDIFEAREKRHSVRNIDASREVAPELVEELLRCACLASTAGNVQPRKPSRKRVTTYL